jgi:hypothetical protein
VSVKAPAPVAAQVSIRLIWMTSKERGVRATQLRASSTSNFRKVVLQDVDDDRIDLEACHVTQAEEALRQYVPAATDADRARRSASVFEWKAIKGRKAKQPYLATLLLVVPRLR